MTESTIESGKGAGIASWALKALAGLAFLAAGGAKLVGVAQMVAVFDKIGLGQWFRYVTGVLEVIAAIGLFIPRFSFYSAVLLGLCYGLRCRHPSRHPRWQSGTGDRTLFNGHNDCVAPPRETVVNLTAFRVP